MSIGIQDLSDELIVQLTKILGRRPEYGIAIPSRRWLQRQEEKLRQLPKELSRPSGFKRLAIKIVDSIDPNIVDPQAILCKTHSRLNPFLIRRLFIALAYEVTVHTDPIRSWQGRISDPELSAFVGRLDSITALWTEPPLFHEIYGLAPFDGHHVFVRSACEACCLAAVGASGRALADLRAALIDRTERRKEKGSGKPPRLYRVVEAWIDHLRKNNDGGRPEECRASSEALLIELRTARPQISAWRAEQKRRHAELRAAQRPVYSELKRTSTGAKIAPLPASAGHKRRTRNGIPVALADVEGAKEQRRAAMFGHQAESIYRPDSLAAYSGVNMRQQVAYDPPTGEVPRPRAPEPVRDSGPSDGLPTQSFLRRFEQEMTLDEEHDSYDDAREQELEDEEYSEESRRKVQDWWANRLSKSQLDLGRDDAETVLSMMHPAFRPGSRRLAESALPVPLHVKKDCNPQPKTPGEQYVPARNAWNREPQANTPEEQYVPQSVWTDCTVYTTHPNSLKPGTNDIPPIPRIPSAYRHHEHPSGSGQGTTSVEGNQIVQDKKQSATSHPQHEESTVTRSPKRSKAPLNWPAPPQGRSQQFFLPNSDAGSMVSAQRFDFLQERFKMKGSQAPRPTSPTPRTRTPSTLSTNMQASSSVYDKGSVTSISSAVPSTDLHRPRSRTKVVPKPVTVESEIVRPDDSASNVHRGTRRPSLSSVTQLGAFQGRM
ncbi:hypothetical protein GGS24DRAFT_109832 [Hypoxylon argillaceum]|nr:hypothetical protein GGS24DRAFT_109832 [Hypoxylon argillaceum]